MSHPRRTRLPEPPPGPTREMTRSEALALGQQGCFYCFGLGMRPGRQAEMTPCNCVYRAIFRACHTRFRTIAQSGAYCCQVKPEHGYLPGLNRRGYGMKWQEYAADFVLIAQRYLCKRDLQVFRAHCLLGADWKLCAYKLGIDKGQFFSILYEIQQRLGRIYYEIRPHALFPLDEYFSSSQRGNGGDEAFKDEPYALPQEGDNLDGAGLDLDALPDFPKRNTVRKQPRALSPPLAKKASGD